MLRPVTNPIYRMRNNSALINTVLKSTTVVLIALVAYAVLAMFAMSDSATSESTKALVRVNRDTGKLQFGKATSIGTSIQRTSQAKAQVRALSLASADFDEDGAPDLLTGYDTGRAGMITMQRGNVNAFAPKDSSIFDQAAAGHLPPSLLMATVSFGIPERADMILTGDFNDDGHKDLLTAAQAGSLYLLKGDGHGSFDPAQKLQLPGTVAALTAGAFSHSSGWLAVIAAIDGPQGSALAIFDQNQEGLSATPTIMPLASRASALSLGLMDDDSYFDLAVASGSQVLIIHGQRPTLSGANNASNLQDRVEVIDIGAEVLSVVTGDFLGDSNAVSDIAALTASGQVAILQRTPATAKQYPILDLDSIAPDQLRQLIRTRREDEIREANAKPTWQPGGVEKWNIVRQMDAGIGKIEERSSSLLTKSGISSRSAEDLVLLDKGGRQVKILVGVNSELDQDSGDLQATAHVPTALAGDTAPVAVLTMASKFNGERDLVVLRAGQATADLLPLAPLSLTVNRTTDSARSPIANQCNGVADDCSLREAVLKTNSTTGPHTIIVPAGTYNLSVNNPNTPATTGTTNLPDLEIGSAFSTDTTLMGTGGKPVINQTINLNDVITTGFIDAVLTPQIVTLSLQNIEVSGGTFTGIFTGADNGTSSSNTTINNASIHNNSNGDATFGQGGSIFNQCGTLTIQNSTFSSNSATNLNTAQGGAIFYNLANASGQCSTGNLTIANTTFTNNTSALKSGLPGGGAIFTSIVSAGTASAITNSTFNANVVTGGGDGGAIAVSHAARTQNILSSTFINNSVTNAAGRGGAISANAGTTNITFNRLINNTTSTVTNGRGIFRNGGTANADDNWWGVNTGPAANDLLGLTVTKSLQLRNTATPATVLLGGTTTLTANFLTDSANTPILPSNLFPLAGLPVIWNNVLKGTLSNTQTSIQAVRNIAAAPTGATESGSNVTITTTVAHGFSVGQSVTIAGVSEPGYNGTFNITSVTTNSFTYTNTTTGLGTSGGGTATVPFGTATTTFTAGTNSASCGAGGATATVDSQPVAGLVTVQCPDLTAVKTNNVANVAVVGQTWNWSQTIVNGGDAAANFSGGQTILLDNLPNSIDISYTVLTPSIFLGGPNSGTVDCSINGSKDLTCTANGAVTIGVGGQFQVVISARANIAGTYANPRALGISRVDPNDNVVESNEGNQDSSNTVTVNPANTTTTITNGVALGTASVVGQPVTVQWSVTVNPPGSVGAALTGNVTVSDGTNNCTAAIASGQCDITFTTAGAKSLTASYAGDANYNGSISTPATPHTVNKADTTNAITNLSVSPSVVGQAVTVQWSVSVNAPGSVGAALTGNVTVSDGTANCIASVSTGQCDITFTTAGARNLTATYAGDTNYNGSASSPATPHTVNPANTTTTISNAASLTATPSVVGQAVTVTWSVTVNAPGGLGAALTGNVTVTDGTDGCTAPVSDGQCNVTFNTVGAKLLTAQYAGDSNYNGSTSASASHTVNQASTVTSITNGASLTGTTSVVGEAVLVQWSVTVSAPGALGAALTGTVTASDGVNSCNAPVATGQCSIIFTSPGAKNITAQYSGDTNYAGSTSTGVSHTVNQSNSLTTITSDAPDPSNVGQSVTVNFSVVAVAPGAGTPTGNVNVTVSGGAETCTGTVAAGGCSLTLNAPGTRTITATYVGDANFTGSSDTEQHDVSNAPPDVSVRDARVAEPTSGTANMLFTIVLSTPAPGGGVTVNFSTASGGANPATPGTDYTPIVGGSVNFTSGQQIKTVPVTILPDADNSETDETLLLNLTGATGGNIFDNQATGTITPAGTAGTFLISELRTSGPAGPDDDFVELYNNTDSPVTIAASDASAGYGLYKKGADCDATPILIATIPNGTVIPARGHYLVVGSAYSLAANAAGNQTMTSNLEADANVAIFSTADVGNISSATALDAVGFGSNTGSVCDLLREGTTLPALGISTLEYSFERDPCGKGGNPGIFGGCPSSTPIDKNNNATDFLFADTTAANTIAGQRLGAPGPENLASPLLRNSTVAALFLDATIPSGAAPNRFRDLTPVTNGASGTLAIRRRVVNNTGTPVTRLRFRVVDITSAPVPGGIADVRALTSGSIVVNGVNDSATCLASTGSPATPCTITVQGTTLETPPAHPNGGGINSTMSAGTITLGTPLAPGASANVQFLLGVQVTGTFKFYINIEALP